uniref:B-cell lymphoma 3 protein-like n=1 Tax=Lonchura striata TaxID=40157 RepID=UPI000B4DA131
MPKILGGVPRGILGVPEPDFGGFWPSQDIKSGRSPLLHAVESGSLEMAELLLQHGASVNAQSYAGCTALHAAAGRGLLRLLRLLLRCGADCGLRNLHNDTAAAVAASAQ